MTEVPYLQQRKDTLLLAVKVTPRASRNEILSPQGDELRVKVTAPPVEAAANRALLAFLAGTLSCPRRQLTLIRGDTSRHKLIAIQGLSLSTVLERLTPGA